MKNILFTLTFLAIAVGLVYYFDNQKKHQWDAKISQGTGELIYNSFLPSTVASILIEQDSARLLISRDSENVWRLVQRDYYPVNTNLITDFLLKLQQGKISEEINCPEEELHRLGLDNASSARISLLNQSGKLLYPILRLGQYVIPDDAYTNPNATLLGRYYSLEQKPVKHFFSTLSLDNTPTQPRLWLDKNFIKIDDLNRVEYSSAQDSFSFSRRTRAEPFKSSNVEKISDDDADTASYYLNALSFDDVKKMLKILPVSIGCIKTSSFSGKIVELHLYKIDGSIWVKVNTFPEEVNRYNGYLFRAPDYMFKYFFKSH